MQEAQEAWVQSLGQEESLEEEMATHSSILPGENPTDRGAWQAIVHGVAKESNTTQRLNNRHQRQNRGERCQSEARGLLKERFETQMEWRL